MDRQRKRKSAADRRAEIVDTVIELSAALGPDRVTTQHLADAVGVTQPAIFRHFATKTDIWEAVGERVVKEIETVAIEVGESEDPVRAYLTKMAALVRSYPALPSIVSSRELQAQNEPLRAALVAALQVCRTQVIKLIGDGQARGTYRNDISPESMARLVMSTCSGMCVAWVIEDHAFDLATRSEETIEALSTMLAPC